MINRSSPRCSSSQLSHDVASPAALLRSAWQRIDAEAEHQARMIAGPPERTRGHLTVAEVAAALGITTGHASRLIARARGIVGVPEPVPTTTVIEFPRAAA